MLRRSVLIMMLGCAAFAAGCSKASHAAVKEMSVADAYAAHQSGAVFVDANGEEFRRDNGKVPGAVLLANYRTYDVKSALPENKDTPLVFYCSNRL